MPDYLSLITDLGKGEASVIALAMVVTSKALVIMDDKLGRQFAQIHNLKVTGTAGLLLKAKQKGFLHEIAPHLDALREADFYLSEQAYKNIL